MDTRIIKAVVALASLAYSVYLFAGVYIFSGIMMTLLTAVLVLIFLRSIRMMMVFLAVRKQNMVNARKWLSRINPNHLWKNQRGYFYFLQATANAETQSMAQSEKDFRAALSHGLRFDHDKAMVYLNLAVLMANKRRKREAVNYLSEAKKHDTKSMMRDQIKQVKDMVNKI